MKFSWSRLSEYGLIAVLVFSILWRGGKGLEATWLLALMVAFAIIISSLRKIFRFDQTEPLSPLSPAPRKTDIPVFLWITILLYVAWSIASYFLSTTRNYGLDEILRTVSLSLLLFWAVRTGLDGKQRFLFLSTRAIAYSSIIAAIIGIAVYVLQPVDRFVGTFFDYRFTTDYWPNAWAEFTLLAWPFMVIECMRTTKNWVRWILITGIGLVIGSLFLSYSRGGFLALVVQLSLLFVIFLYLGLRDIRYRRILRTIRDSVLVRIALITVFTVAMFLSVNLLRSNFHEVQSVAQKVTFTAAEGTSSIDERKEFWQQALELSKDRPLFGYGPYSFRFVQPHLADHVLATSDHPHNVLLKIAMESGWPALLFYALVILYILGIAFKMLFAERREWSQEKDIVTIMLLLAVIGVFAHNMIDYNLQFVGIAMPLVLALGFLVVPTSSSQESVSSSFIRWKFSQYLFRFQILLSAVLIAILIAEGYPLALSSIGRHYEAAGNIDEALIWYGKAQHEWFSRDMFLSEAQIYLNKNDLGKAMEAVNRYLTVNTEDPRVWKLRAMIALRMGDMPLAESSIDTAYADGKYTDLQIFELLLETAKDPQRKALLLPRKEEFDTLFSDYATAVEQDVHFIDLSQAPEMLMQTARDLSNLYPTDDARYVQIARKAFDHAVTERAANTARKPGILW
ncbi:MAG TPA: O-antigen ligase family protein [Candidatus Peribacteraceae bacterium]|nr:O-antigen ligase family protein [Candidatus Peribacteraceae bacterium]